MRMTKQKKILQQELEKLTSFFDTEELYHKAAKLDSTIGIATVYRFLKNCAEKGDVHSYLCKRKTIYSTNKKNHCHFTCENCGDVKHINIKNIDFVQLKEKICHFQVDMTGICDKCARKGV